MNVAKGILAFVLIFTIIAWIFGFINLNPSSYEGMDFQEQSQIIGDQFNKAVEKGTKAIKNIADVAMEGFNLISTIVKTIGNGIGKIAEFFKIDVFFDNITGNYGPGASGGGEGGFQGGGGFGGGGGSSW